LRETLDRAKALLEKWCAGRLWYWRAPLVLYLAYVGIRHLLDPEYSSLFGGINLGIHELGHLLLLWAPQFLTVLGGTLLQCAAPVIAAVLFVRQPDYFAVPVCGAWLSTNLYSVATYMADARRLELPLVTVGAEGGDVEHDWNYLLDALGILSWDTTLAALTRGLAFLLMWSSLALAAWMLWVMARAKSRADGPFGGPARSP
jgi:hypothetical protein